MCSSSSTLMFVSAENLPPRPATDSTTSPPSMAWPPLRARLVSVVCTVALWPVVLAAKRRASPRIDP